MDLMIIAVSFFTVVITCVIGFFIIQRFFPYNNNELEITKAFKNSEYERVIELSEGKESSSRNSFNIYSCTAQSFSNQGLYYDAIRWWETALRKLNLSTSDRIFIDVSIGDEYSKLKELKTAEIYYRTAVSLDQTNEKANHHLAKNLYDQGQFEQARKTLHKLLKANPSLIDSRKLYAECLASMGLFARAIRHYGILERIDEHIFTYNYALTLKNIKVWDKAFEVYKYLLEHVTDEREKEIIVKDLVSVCISMKKYPDSLGIIDRYLPEITSADILLELKYMRANIFYLRGDQMIALQEYYNLYQENHFYKDLKDIVEKDEHWLKYPFLFNYFTSNESIFESLVTRLAPVGAKLVRRSPQYYICVKDLNAYVFYRDINPLLNSALSKIETVISYFCPTLEKLELWSLSGIEGHHAISGQKYQLIIREHDDFLVQTNIIVSQMDHLDGAEPLGFVEGHRELDEIIPKTEEEINATVDEILSDTPTFLEDDFISKALD